MMKLIVLCLVLAPCWAIKEPLDNNAIDIDDKKTPTKKATLIGKKPSEKKEKNAKNPALEKKSTSDEEKSKVLFENNVKGFKEGMDLITKAENKMLDKAYQKKLIPTPIHVDNPYQKDYTNQRIKLRKELLELRHYNKDTHPVKNHTSVVKVNIGMALIHVDLNELSSILEVDAWMRLTWIDDHLSWNKSDFDDLDQVHFGPGELWKPDIYLYNNARTDVNQHDQYSATQYLVFNNGKVLWVPPAKLSAFCKIDLRLWPLDTQTCSLKFGSWTSHGDQIDIGLYNNNSKVDELNFYTTNREWQLQSTSAKISRTQYPCCKEMYPDITFEFVIKRRSPTYRATVILPCLLTMLLVVSSFLLPPNAGEKLTINTISLVICTLYLLYLSNSLPALSDHIPLIVLFFSNTAALIGIAIVLNVVCLSITRERKYRKPPKFLRNLFTGLLGKFLCLGNYYHQVSDTHQRLMVEMEDVNESPESEQDTETVQDNTDNVASQVMKDWFLVAAGIERFFFLVYSMAFAIVSSVYI